MIFNSKRFARNIYLIKAKFLYCGEENGMTYHQSREDSKLSQARPTQIDPQKLDFGFSQISARYFNCWSDDEMLYSMDLCNLLCQ